MAGPVDRSLLPDVLKGDGTLNDRKTQDILYLFHNAIQFLKRQLENLTAGGGVTVTGAAGIVFIDIDLTANHSISDPTVPGDSVLIYTFTQSNGGGWTVTWTASFTTAPRVATLVGWKTTVMWRSIAGGTFEPIRDHGSYEGP